MREIFTEQEAADYLGLSQLLGFSKTHAQLCARLFDRLNDIEPATEWYSTAGKDGLRFHPRKADGIEYTVAVVDAWRFYKSKLSEGMENKAALDAVDQHYSPPKQESGVKVKSVDVVSRLARIASEAIIALPADHQLRKRWATPEAMLDDVESTPVSEDEAEALKEFAVKAPEPWQVPAMARRGRPKSSAAKVLRFASPDQQEDGTSR